MTEKITIYLIDKDQERQFVDIEMDRQYTHLDLIKILVSDGINCAGILFILSHQQSFNHTIMLPLNDIAIESRDNFFLPNHTFLNENKDEL